MPRLDLLLTGHQSHEIQIVANGDSTRNLCLGRTEIVPEEESESPRLDPVAVFAAAANAGFLGGDNVEPWLTRARVLEGSAEQACFTLRWKLRVEHLPVSALRILVNVISFCKFTKQSLAINGSAQAKPLNLDELASLPYPAVFEPCPFAIVRSDTMKRAKDRRVRIIFKEPPASEVVDESYGALDLWIRLLNVGAYPRSGEHPAKSGVLPDLAILLDEVTIEQAFPEAFFCDEAAFNSLANWVTCLHRRQAIEELEIA